MADDLETTKAELADILELLKDSPDDEELLGLKNDLEELIALEEGGPDPAASKAPPPSGVPPSGVPPAAALGKFDEKAAAFLTHGEGGSAKNKESRWGEKVKDTTNTKDDLMSDLTDEKVSVVVVVVSSDLRSRVPLWEVLLTSVFETTP